MYRPNSKQRSDSEEYRKKDMKCNFKKCFDPCRGCLVVSTCFDICPEVDEKLTEATRLEQVEMEEYVNKRRWVDRV